METLAVNANCYLIVLIPYQGTLLRPVYMCNFGVLVAEEIPPVLNIGCRGIDFLDPGENSLTSRPNPPTILPLRLSA